eukprot:1412491-Pleurochrysis_carterae.AAC.1
MRPKDANSKGILVTSGKLQVDLMEDTRNGGVMEVVYLPFVSSMEKQLASPIAREDDDSQEDPSDMVLHEPQLQALQALEQWSDNFSADVLPSREAMHEEEA